MANLMELNASVFDKRRVKRGMPWGCFVNMRLVDKGSTPAPHIPTLNLLMTPSKAININYIDWGWSRPLAHKGGKQVAVSFARFP